MREVFADFNDLAHTTRQGEPGPRAPLGYEESAPDLEGLQEGERVLLSDWGQLAAPGVVVSEQTEHGRYWYGIVTGPWHEVDAWNAEAIAQQ